MAASKNVLDPSVLSVFQSTDRIVRRSDDVGLPKGVMNDLDDEDDGPFNVIYYETTTKIARDRLELQGYTLENARRLFEESMRLQARDEDPDDGAKFLGRARHLQLSVDQWMSYQRHQSSPDEIGGGNAGREDHGLDESLIRELQRDDTIVDECPDPLVGVRLSIENAHEAKTIVYNLTTLIQADELNEDEDPFQHWVETEASESFAQGRTIVLTEGRTDSWILKDSMALLYPHVAEQFSFMEFSEFRAAGGAGPLANLVKSFAAAGILNRVVAIFDNDAASAAALLSLRSIKLPQHIVVLTLPDQPTLVSYPTIGPTGPANMNINGMAASIELYLGGDVLEGADGRSPPIQWTGYENSVGKYQGELTVKADVQTRFKGKLRRAQADEQFRRTADWSGVNSILEAILSAFHRLDGVVLSRQLNVFYL